MLCFGKLDKFSCPYGGIEFASTRKKIAKILDTENKDYLPEERAVNGYHDIFVIHLF